MTVFLAAKFLSLFIKLMLCTKIKSEGIDSIKFRKIRALQTFLVPSVDLKKKKKKHNMRVAR